MSPAVESILVVCTGNLCRSPAAAALLQAALPTVRVTSAGTRALVGAPVAAPMAALLAADGHPMTDFAATQVEAGHLRAADLVLTATAEHRAAVVELAPAVVRRAFTILEFARIVKAGPLALGGAPLPEVVPRVAAARFAVAAELDDLRDPYGLSDAVHLQVYDRIRTAVGTMLGRRVPVG